MEQLSSSMTPAIKPIPIEMTALSNLPVTLQIGIRADIDTIIEFAAGHLPGIRSIDQSYLKTCLLHQHSQGSELDLAKDSFGSGRYDSQLVTIPTTLNAVTFPHKVSLRELENILTENNLKLAGVESLVSYFVSGMKLSTPWTNPEVSLREFSYRDLKVEFNGQNLSDRTVIAGYGKVFEPSYSSSTFNSDGARDCLVGGRIEADRVKLLFPYCNRENSEGWRPGTIFLVERSF